MVLKELIFNSFYTRGGVTNEDDVQLPWTTEGAGITNSIEDQKQRPMRSPDEEKRPWRLYKTLNIDLSHLYTHLHPAFCSYLRNNLR